MDKVAGKTLQEWINQHPILLDMINDEEVFWENPLKNQEPCIPSDEIKSAESLLRRFSPYFRLVFPETASYDGLIESTIKSIPSMKQKMESAFQMKIPGALWLKCDHELAVAGSVKARGGIYEVLKLAEDLAYKHQLIEENEDYSQFAEERFKNFFENYTIVVGSTGNLGLSIGLMGTSLGFKVKVHMSMEAKEWKKNLLREKGAIVIEHYSDYNIAVEMGRHEAEQNPNSYFVDDENSKDLFFGYSVAAIRLAKQLDDQNILVNKDHPLYVYLPCGVGGAPGGITFGLKQKFGEHVHCYFAEPTAYPAMLLGLLTNKHNNISVQDFGIFQHSEADGLAVGRPSGFVGKKIQKLVEGCFTIQDKQLMPLLKMLWEAESIFLEPSALAGFLGPVKRIENQPVPETATHLIWATGGSLVPESIKNELLK